MAPEPRDHAVKKGPARFLRIGNSRDHIESVYGSSGPTSLSRRRPHSAAAVGSPATQTFSNQAVETPFPDFMLCQLGGSSGSAAQVPDISKAHQMSLNHLRNIAFHRPSSAPGASCLPRRPRSFGDCRGPLAERVIQREDVVKGKSPPRSPSRLTKPKKLPPGAAVALGNFGLEVPDDESDDSSPKHRSSTKHRSNSPGRSKNNQGKSTRSPAADVGKGRPKSAGGGLLGKVMAENAKKMEMEKRNPFIAFEDKEMRKVEVRKWLVKSPEYMKEKKIDLEHEAMVKARSKRMSSADDLYDARIFYGPYSIAMQAMKGEPKPDLKAQAATAVMGGPKGKGKQVLTPAASMKEMQKSIEDSVYNTRKAWGLVKKEEEPKEVMIHSMAWALKGILSIASGVQVADQDAAQALVHAQTDAMYE